MASPTVAANAYASAARILETAGAGKGSEADGTSFGAVLNFTLLHEAPDAASMVDRLLDPLQRGGLPGADLVRLTEVVALGLHNTYLLAGVLSVVALGLALLLPARLSPARH